MEELVNSKTLVASPSVTDINSADDDTVAASNLEPIEIFLEQPDGSKVRISFLASGEIEGVPQTYELAPNVEVVEEPSQSLAMEDSEPLTFVDTEESQQISAIQTPDGQIYYFEANPLSKNGKDSVREAPIFYTLLPKDVYITPDFQHDSAKELTESNLSNKDTKDNVYTTAREKLKPFVTVHKTRRRTESAIKQIGGDLPLEDKMAALAALLPAPRVGRRIAKRRRKLGAGKDGDGKQDLAGTKQVDASAGSGEALQRAEAESAEAETADTSAKASAEFAEDARRDVAEAKEAQFRCDMCDSAFDRAAQLFGHSKAHARERTLRCPHCVDGKVFAAHAQLARHERACHVSVRAHACAKCDATFDRKCELANHERRIHLQERGNACVVCTKAFFKRSDLRAHLNIHLGLDAHVCPTCGRRFGHVSNLNRHLRTHTGARPFVCSFCGRRFAQPSSLWLHHATHSPTRQRILCPAPSCLITLRHEGALLAHLRTRHPGLAASHSKQGPKRVHRPRSFHCRVCGQAFPFAALLRSHEADHAREEAFRCTWCRQHLPSLELIKNHACRAPNQRERVSERPVLTESASEQTVLAEGATERAVLMERLLGPEDEGHGSQDIVVYVTQDGREQQVLIESACRRVDITSLCEATLDEPSALQGAGMTQGAAETQGLPVPLMPMRSILKTKVSSSLDVVATRSLLTCEREDLTSVDLGEPRAVQDQDEAARAVEEAEEDAREAEKVKEEAGCVKESDMGAAEGEEVLGLPAMSSLGRLKAEEQTSQHSDVAALPADQGAPPPQKGPSKDGQSFVCTAVGCGKTFQRRANYKQHLGTHFANAKRHLCATCGESFAWQSTLAKHAARHTPADARPRHACAVCGKTYPLVTQVQEHMKRDHEVQRPHSCPECAKTFFKKHDLTVHLRTHTKETPYMCAECGRRFTHASHLARHEAVHAGRKPHACPTCGRRFAQASAMRTHLVKHAGPTNQGDRTDP